MLALRGGRQPRRPVLLRPTTLSETLLTATFPGKKQRITAEKVCHRVSSNERACLRVAADVGKVPERVRRAQVLASIKEGLGHQVQVRERLRVLELVGTTRTPEPADARVVSRCAGDGAEHFRGKLGGNPKPARGGSMDRVAELAPRAHKIHFEKGGASGLVGAKMGETGKLLFFPMIPIVFISLK